MVDVIFTTENPDNNLKTTQCLATALEVLSPPVSEGSVPNTVTTVAKKSYIVLAATPAQSE